MLWVFSIGGVMVLSLIIAITLRIARRRVDAKE
jgi:hypothetical protein